MARINRSHTVCKGIKDLSQICKTMYPEIEETRWVMNKYFEIVCERRPDEKWKLIWDHADIWTYEISSLMKTRFLMGLRLRRRLRGWSIEASRVYKIRLPRTRQEISRSTLKDRLGDQCTLFMLAWRFSEWQWSVETEILFQPSRHFVTVNG